MNTQNSRRYIIGTAIVLVCAFLVYIIATLVVPAWKDGAFSLQSKHKDTAEDELVCDSEATALMELLRIDKRDVLICSVQDYTLADRFSTAKLVSIVTVVNEKQIPVSRVWYHDTWYPVRNVQNYHKLFTCESILYDKPNGSSYLLFLLPGDKGFGWQWQLTDYSYTYTGTGTGDSEKTSACVMNGIANYPYHAGFDDSQLTYTFDAELCLKNGGTNCTGIQAAIENDVSVCTTNANADQEEICTSMVAIFQNQPELCSELSNSERVDLCMTHSAIRQWSRELCESVENASLKESCFDTVTTTE